MEYTGLPTPAAAPPFDPVLTDATATRLRLKSPTFTLKYRSTIRFGDLRSRWMMGGA
jgi:hypothetical protein